MSDYLWHPLKITLLLLMTAMVALPGTGMAAGESSGAEVIVISEEISGVPLGPKVHYLRDPSGSLELADVSSPEAADNWQPGSDSELNFGYTQDTYWLRLHMQPSHPVTKDYLLELAYPLLGDIRAFILRDGEPPEVIQLGIQQPYHERLIDHPSFILPVSLSDAGVTTLYLRIQTESSMQLPLYIWDSQALVERNYQQAVVQALFYGAMLVMVLYNLMLFIAIRDISFLYYVMHVFCMLLFLLGMHGVSYKFLWPDAVYWNSASLLIALSGAVLFPCLFTRRFLALPEHRPMLSKALLGVVGLSALVAVSALFVSYANLVMYAILASVLSIITNFYAGIVRWWDGYHPARYYNLAWMLLLTGAFVFALNKMGVIPRNWLTENGVTLGVSAEIILLSFALANRMNEERRLREEAQRETALTQQQLLQAQIQQNEQLDQLVRERTTELENANAKLTEMSMTDDLTGCRNRRFLDQALKTEFRRAQRQQSNLALLMIDIDNFKQLNDRHGHAMGDACLAAVARRISDNVRRTADVMARYGGEEFVVLLPELPDEGAWEVARGILRAMNQSAVAVDGHSFDITVSIGLATTTPDSDDHDHETLLREADKYLYLAKAKGRNCIVGEDGKRVMTA